MKKRTFIFVIIFALPFISSAQGDSLKRSTIYKIWITMGGGREIKGTIYKLTDSSIFFADTFKKMDLLSPDKFEIQIINYDKIYLVTCRKELWPGAVIGMVAGAFSGAILGKLTGRESDDPMERRFENFRTFVFGLLFTVPGAVAGIMVTDMFTIRIPISGNSENFKKNKSRLKKYSYIQ